ncbi:unnamed protein product [Lepeophtheirus salmonis]|uniref:(salmon louse) hypothetical protein n=1 Tax=Lepeophtheirus salmonis TaxID=72036 RepID=A0A7R8D938_LEPSM|nr:unnamed protein product [Lepeophtheirus salmonis]CAF3013867.1 unnamed protein product [Lepeophtheirus salmonis]
MLSLLSDANIQMCVEARGGGGIYERVPSNLNKGSVNPNQHRLDKKQADRAESAHVLDWTKCNYTRGTTRQESGKRRGRKKKIRKGQRQGGDCGRGRQKEGNPVNLAKEVAKPQQPGTRKARGNKHPGGSQTAVIRSRRGEAKDTPNVRTVEQED